MKKRLSLQEFVVTRQAAAAMASQDATAEVADSELKKSKKKQDEKANKANKGTTDTGMPKNEIELNPQMDTSWTMYEEKDKHVVFAFGRMNPPTTGHEKLVDTIQAHAKKVGGDAHVYLSKSHDKKKNPLNYETKHAFAKKAFGDVVKHTPEGHSNVHGILKHLHSLGYSHATLIAGDDRVKDYQRIANDYNGPGKDYNFKKIKVVSAGARDPDAEGVEGMSASKMRAHASAGSHEEFKKGLPKNLQKHSKDVMNTLRGALNEELTPEELQEVISVATRIKKAAKARTMKSRLAMGRKRALKRKASRSTLTRRAQRTARKFMRARILRGQKYSDLSYSARAALDRRMKLKSKSVSKLAQKLLPRISAGEQRRKLGGAFKTPAGLGRMAGLARESLDLIIRQHIPLAESIIYSLSKKAEHSGIPYEILETVYYRGVADYAAGHRPTITSQQWAFNRVNSFIHEGSTYYTADKDLTEGVMAVKAAQKAALQLNKKGKKTIEEEGGAGYQGTPELVKRLKKDTPGQDVTEEKKIKGFRNYTTACSEAIEAPYDPARSSKLDMMQAEQMRKSVTPSWDMIQGHHLEKTFVGKDYVDIEMFISRVNKAAVELDHFPEVSNFYNEATVKVGTTDVDGLTAVDFTLARKIDEIAGMLGLKDEVK